MYFLKSHLTIQKPVKAGDMNSGTRLLKIY